MQSLPGGPLRKPTTEPIRMRLKYAGQCIACGRNLSAGTEALYYPDARFVRCVLCPPIAGPVGTDTGVAGASTRRELERRRERREARTKDRFGSLAGLVLASAKEPHWIRSWERGAIGEEDLAAALARVPDIRVLNDRLVPWTRGNIDHIVVGPA